MMATEKAALKLVKGGAATVPGQPNRRRSAVRRTPRPADPIEDLLQHLDEEPAAPETPDEPAEPAKRRSVRHRIAVRRPRSARKKPPTPTNRRRPSWTALALAVAMCAAVALAAFLGSRWYGDHTLDTARQQAVAAAKQTTVNFVSVSAATVDRDLKRIADGATGDFKDEFTRGQAQVRAAVVENNVDSRGAVLRAALVSGTRRAAVVLVAVDATVKNTKVPDGRVSHYRIQVDVARDPASGRWLVSRLQFVG
jgi:Mce-associated membrane protein